MTQSRDNEGFTLIEFLIVLTMIIIIAGMIITGVRNAYNKTLRASCVSNIRAINQALLLYTVDFPDEPHPAGSDAKEWYGCLYYLQEQGRAGGITAMDVYVCPATKHKPPTFQGFGQALQVTARNSTQDFQNPDFTGTSIDYWVVKEQEAKGSLNFYPPDIRTMPDCNVLIIEASEMTLSHHSDGRSISFKSGKAEFITSLDPADYPVNLLDDGTPECYADNSPLTVAMEDRTVYAWNP